MENTTDEVIENDLPEMQKTKSGNTLQVIGAIVIVVIGIGSLLFLSVGAGNNDTVKEETEKPIENNLPALVVNHKPQAKPVNVIAVKETKKIEPIKRPLFIKPQPKSKPAKTGGKKEKVVTWYDRKKASGTLKGELADPRKQNNVAPADQKDGFLLSDGSSGQGETDLDRQLVSSSTPMAIASMLPDRNYIIAQGTSLDCSLETALDSTLSGLTTCILSRDIYSDNGRVLLLERGSKLTGEYTGGLRNGQRRLFVLWNRAKTPKGVIISLNSPSADSLGRSGMEGWVDTHFLERFGTAIFLSVLSDGARIYAAKQSTDGGVIVGGGAETGSDVAEKILDYQADIPPTLIKNQGETIKVMVARDLNFSSVYKLKVDY